MSLVQSNYRGVTKKMTITAMMFMAYCAGNIAGPHFFRYTEAPRYETAFQTILICYVLVIGLAIGLRCYLQWINKRRTIEEGIEGNAGTAGVLKNGKLATTITESTLHNTANEPRPELEADDDVTDWETVGFRYRL
uniref:Major facilitator superfamily (MFS) profile domain-containing protein n=1 Tax=Bionectria ochroleuca TaxID=29856 RepID=A0A8H7KBV0_BIOOC